MSAGPVPTPAERARGVLAAATTVEVGVLSMTVPVERHAVDGSGALLLRAPVAAEGCPLALAGRLPSPVLVATATDVSSVAQPDRLRGRVRLTGTLERVAGPVPDDLAALLGGDGRGDRPVLRLRPVRVALDWRVGPAGAGGFVPVDPAAYAAAPLDPLAGWEAAWTDHLARGHEGLADALARGVRPDLGDGAYARPLLVDRGGLTLRVYDAAGRRQDDVHLPTRGVVRCGCDARRALEELVRALGPSHHC